MFAEIAISVLAVFGLYAALHLLLAMLLRTSCVGVVIKVLTPTDAAHVDLLLFTARVNGCFFKRNAPVVLVSHQLAGDTALLQRLAEYRAEIHYI